MKVAGFEKWVIKNIDPYSSPSVGNCTWQFSFSLSPDWQTTINLRDKGRHDFLAPQKTCELQWDHAKKMSCIT
jgi:hypothetical protein